ncbi:hypothetical protein B0O99DRAFT_599344 [Bisporella sp. PMI_857]|nr:hypothetical protein B0O99DRAFT_599344 [Bisporella sp. PMI_857]
MAAFSTPKHKSIIVVVLSTPCIPHPAISYICVTSQAARQPPVLDIQNPGGDHVQLTTAAHMLLHKGSNFLGFYRSKKLDVGWVRGDWSVRKTYYIFFGAAAKRSAQEKRGCSAVYSDDVTHKHVKN